MPVPEQTNWQPGPVFRWLLDSIGRPRDPEEDRCLAVITRLLSRWYDQMRTSGEEIPDGPLSLEVVIEETPRFTLITPAFGVLPDLATSDLNGITVTVQDREGSGMDESQLLSRLGEICLRLPEVRETTKWGHPTFEAGKKMFAVLDHYNGRPCLAFRAAPEQLPAYLTDKRFFEAPYAARHGWLCLRADAPLDWREVEELVRGSYRQVALKRMLAVLEGSEQARRWAGRGRSGNR